jgi:endonuclease/exonuclease/phosphatase family metal-dependent hydrolase
MMVPEENMWRLVWLEMILVLVIAILFSSTSQAQAESVELRVMTFNIWLGGVQVDFVKVVEAVQAAQADVVGLQEAEGHTRRLAEALGWSYADERLQIISRYPLIDPPGGNGIYTFVEVQPGRVVAVANVHLPSSPYGPEAVRDGGSVEEVLALERDTRLPAIAPQLKALPPLVAQNIPVFLTGDFNTPSTLNSQLVGEADGPEVDIAITPWPSDHRALVSTFKVTPVVPPVLVAANRRAVTVGEEIMVRYHAPGNEGERIVIVPAQGNLAQDALMSLPPQESAVDGSAIFGTASLQPGPYEAGLVDTKGAELARIPFWVLAKESTPEVSLAKTTYAVNEPIVVKWQNAPGYRWDWLGIYQAGEVDLGNYITYLYTGATIAGSVTFDGSAFSEPLPAGAYEVRLMRDDGYMLLATAPFTVTTLTR